MAKVTNVFASYDKGKLAFVGGILVLAILAVGGFLYFRSNERSKYSSFLPAPTPGFTDPRVSTFNVPADLPRAELVDITGGDSFGIATKDFSEGKYIWTVIAELPDISNRYSLTPQYYEAWLGDGTTNNISLGRMYLGKGGWIVNFESKTDKPTYKMIQVTFEGHGDKRPEKVILEGSFQ